MVNESFDNCNEKLGDLEMAGTASDKLRKLGLVYNELTPEQLKAVRDSVKTIIRNLGDSQDRLD